MTVVDLGQAVVADGQVEVGQHHHFPGRPCAEGAVGGELKLQPLAGRRGDLPGGADQLGDECRFQQGFATEEAQFQHSASLERRTHSPADGGHAEGQGHRVRRLAAHVAIVAAEIASVGDHEHQLEPLVGGRVGRRQIGPRPCGIHGRDSAISCPTPPSSISGAQGRVQRNKPKCDAPGLWASGLARALRNSASRMVHIAPVADGTGPRWRRCVMVGLASHDPVYQDQRSHRQCDQVREKEGTRNERFDHTQSELSVDPTYPILGAESYQVRRNFR